MAHAPRTGFQRRARVVDKPALRGTRNAAYGQRVLVSSGTTDLDTVLGGGLVLGTVTLVCEDRANGYAGVLLRSFASTALLCAHPMAWASAEAEQGLPERLARHLPAAASTAAATAPTPSSNSGADSDLRIAWQYQRYHVAGAGSSGSSADEYAVPLDMSQAIAPEVLAQQQPAIIAGFGDADGGYPRLLGLIHQWHSACRAQHGPSAVLRLIVSPVWSPLTGADRSAALKFLADLRLLCRADSLLVIMVSLDPRCCEFLSTATHLADTVLSVEAVPEDPKANVYPDVAAFLRIVKLAPQHMFRPLPLPLSALGITPRRRRLAIAPLALPPELGDAPSRAGTSLSSGAGAAAACSSGVSF